MRALVRVGLGAAVAVALAAAGNGQASGTAMCDGIAAQMHQQPAIVSGAGESLASLSSGSDAYVEQAQAATQVPAAGFEKGADGRYRDARAGIEFLAPMGWVDSIAGDTVVLRSPDGAISITVTTGVDSDAATAAHNLVADACRGLTACAADGPIHAGQIANLPTQSAQGAAQSTQGAVQWRADLVSAKHPVLIVAAGPAAAVSDQDADQSWFRASFELTGRITDPEPIYQPEAAFTGAARQGKVHGTVSMDIVIGADGKVTNPQVTDPIGYGLDREAIKAVLKWRFRPATQDGVPIAMRARVQVTFRLGN